MSRIDATYRMLKSRHEYLEVKHRRRASREREKAERERAKAEALKEKLLMREVKRQWNLLNTPQQELVGFIARRTSATRGDLWSFMDSKGYSDATSLLRDIGKQTTLVISNAHTNPVMEELSINPDVKPSLEKMLKLR